MNQKYKHTIFMKLLKPVLTIIMLLSIMILKAQSYEIKYTYTSDPFKWSINKVECKDNNTYVYLIVKNIAYDTRALNFTHGEYAFTKQKPNGIKSVSNSAITNNKKILYLTAGEEVSIILEFPSIFFINSKEFDLFKEFDLKIATHFNLKDIQLSIPSLADLNKHMQTWEDYYYSNRTFIPSYKNEQDLKTAIKNDVENWQKKGEFETTANWKQRIDDNSREEFIRTTTNNHLSQYKKEQEQIKQEQKALADSYTKYKENLLHQFYSKKIASATHSFSSSDFELMPYDADNETFLIHSANYGDILLPVPINDAPEFKSNWNDIKTSIKPDFVPNGDDVALAKLVFTNFSKDFVYDSHTKANYAIADVKYNFAPIEIAEIDIENLQIDGIPTIPVDVSSNVVGKTSSNILTSKNAQIERVNITASDRSDVDNAIPLNKINTSSNTFAVIIANETYHSVSNVPYAERDGEVFGKYLTRTIGLPQDHVKIYKNASFGNIAAALKHVGNLSEAFGKELNLIFYYTGHGMPNEKTNSPMLIPIDGDAAIPETCYELDKIITTLGGLKANSIIVMLDACFSGTERGDDMLMAARSVRIKSKRSEPIGNMVILSASQGDETAYPYKSEQHGLFTYFLLKKLQEANGNVTLGELFDYITDHVKRQSVVSNGKLQTPTISASSSMQESWRSYKLK